MSAPTVPAHPYTVDELISEDGTVIMSNPSCQWMQRRSNNFCFHYLHLLRNPALWFLVGFIVAPSQLARSPTFKLARYKHQNDIQSLFTWGVTTHAVLAILSHPHTRRYRFLRDFVLSFRRFQKQTFKEYNDRDREFPVGETEQFY